MPQKLQQPQRVPKEPLRAAGSVAAVGAATSAWPMAAGQSPPGARGDATPETTGKRPLGQFRAWHWRAHGWKVTGPSAPSWLRYRDAVLCVRFAIVTRTSSQPLLFMHFCFVCIDALVTGIIKYYVAALYSRFFSLVYCPFAQRSFLLSFGLAHSNETIARPDSVAAFAPR